MVGKPSTPSFQQVKLTKMRYQILLSPKPRLELKEEKSPPHLPLSKEPCSPRRRSLQPRSAHFVLFFLDYFSFPVHQKKSNKKEKCPSQL
jgi:hypothetical protein